MLLRLIFWQLTLAWTCSWKNRPYLKNKKHTEYINSRNVSALPQSMCSTSGLFLGKHAVTDYGCVEVDQENCQHIHTGPYVEPVGPASNRTMCLLGNWVVLVMQFWSMCPSALVKRKKSCILGKVRWAEQYALTHLTYLQAGFSLKQPQHCQYLFSWTVAFILAPQG